MYTLSDRVLRLRQKALSQDISQKEIVGQRLVPALTALAACPPDQPWMLCKSRMLAAVINGAEPVIYPDELLVGYNYPKQEEGQWFEVSVARPKNGQAERLRAYLSGGMFPPETINSAFAALEGITEPIPEIPPRPEDVLRAESEGIFWCQGTSENHTVLGYQAVLEHGFDGIAARVREQLAEMNKVSVETQAFLEGLLIVAEASAKIGRRYAVKARELVQNCPDLNRAAELQRLETVLEQVPALPARTFHEALQSLWFAHIINTWEDGINANSLGRLDQILYPYYRADMEAGRITREEAFELLCCLWIKLYRDYDVQQAALGGLRPDGQDGTNELSYLMLDVTQALDFIRCLSVRLNRNTPEPLLRRALEVVGEGRGIPFFFNDEVLVPALVNAGVSLEDARDYAAIGCVEITIPGRANPHAVSNRINLLKCLELALNDGRSMITGEKFGPHTGDAGKFTCLEEVFQAYEQQVIYFVDRMIEENLRLQDVYTRTCPMPYKSLLTTGCLESGRDFNDRGARYDYHESMPMGIPNVADSLAAIEVLVFREGRYTMRELVETLRANFPGEVARLEFLHRAPKYGNDNDLVDGLAARVFHHYCDLMKAVSERSGVLFFAQPFTFLWLVEAGERTAATPDGRRMGENLAYSISPMQGRDYRGLTALINSLARLPQKMAPGSTSAIVEVEPGLFSEESLGHLVTLVQTAVEKGVGQLQFNVVNEETLRRAQAEPEKYRNLAVRVSGYSQRFCLLDRRLQDHIIARTKHKNL